MKILAFTAVCVLLSIAAKAETANYKASAPRLAMAPNSKASDIKMCPVLDGIVIKTKTGSLEAKSILLISGRSRISASSDGAYRTCYSDIVCPTNDDFMLDKNTVASAERNNDGEYPTTDLAGHSRLMIYGPSLVHRNVTCYYDLLPSKK